MENLKEMLFRVKGILEKLEIHDNVEREKGEKFNFFSVLKIERAEVKHSAMIAELLNPKGLHGQGDTFLKLFIDMNCPFNGFRTNEATVEIEKDLGIRIDEEMKEEKIGRIDIFITDKKKCIVIENKIDAPEQSNQIVRYREYCNKLYPDNFKLLYLTLGGEPAEKASDLEVKKDYYCISYQEDIIKWLEKCLQKCENKHVLYQSISQYINIIKKITNQINLAEMKELEKVIRENLKEAKIIFEGYDKVLNNVSNELRNDVLNRIKIELNTIYPKAKASIEDNNSCSSIFIDYFENYEGRIGIESFNTKGIFENNALFIGKLIFIKEKNWTWKDKKTIFLKDELWNNIDEYSKNKNREKIVEKIVDAVLDYLKEVAINF